MQEGKPDRKSRSAMSTQAAEGPRATLSGTNATALKRLSSRDRKDKSKERKKRRRKEVEIHRIPGVRRIALSELSQKIINCVVGEHITSEKPWTLVKKELIEDNLELHEESSEFLPIRNEIIAFPRKEMLIGFITEEAGEIDEFYICVTEAATDAVQTLINEQQAKQEARLQNSINKVIKSWLTLGSEAEIDETIPKKNRALLEVEIESKYPILPFKIQFRLRTVEKARDGYMELITKDETMSHVFRKRIDNDTQVTPAFRDNEAQTICTYPSNASTQYEYCIDMDEIVWRSYGGKILNYLNKNLSDLMNSLSVNRNINLYLDEYQILGTNTITKRSLLYLNFIEYMAFNDVQLCKGKMISCAHWHQMITGLVAISYADLSLNIFLKKPSTIDEVSQAINGTNPVLIWSFVDPLNPRLILETHREITTISICTFNENLVVGGAVNGQIVLWDIKNRIQKVEEQEILTNAQTKYRSYMKSLMTWMKDIHDVKVVRATAVSDLRHSHSGAVVRIQWISPFEEVGRMGKAHQFFEDTEERSLQFMTAGEDGVVMIWDLLKKPTVGSGGFRERRLKRLKQRPAGLSSEVSPFRVLHLNLKPVYQINLVHPKESRLLPISMMNYMNQEIVYEKTDSLSASAQSICARQTYQARPVYLDRPFVSKFLIGTMEGDFAEAQWEGRDFDLGAVVNSENCMYIQFNKFHDGPIFTIAKHSSEKLKLTAGGKVFAIWSDDFREHPIFWRRSKVYYTHASWYKFFPNRFRLLRSDGVLEIWCISTCSKKPSHSMPVSSGELVSANIHPRDLKQSCLGISDALGNFRIFCLRREDASKVQNAILEESIVDYIDREVKRKKKFLAWQKEWDEKYAKKLEVPIVVKPKTSEELLKEALEQADTEAESKKEEKKDKVKFTEDGGEKKKDRPAPGRYLEWVREKELAKEQERIKKMILKKKSLDTEELEKQRKPLLKLEQENELRRKKQRARIKGSETIFKETVAMLFPAIVKEKPPPPPDPYAGGDPIEDKRKCYAYFSEITDQAERYMKNTKVSLDFNWTSVLKEGRGRRKYLDNTFAKATHHERYESYKSTRMDRKVPQIVTNLASEVDQTSMKDEGDDDAEEDVDDIEPPTDA
ncbi:dynein axonemal intermediate chain 3 [Coccinella septempunctata]|uniref:dynein axonemal intermediate chain 3 n=1 Tax=Coccinella septempunctata TaxID=41139 RepID=UPI001D08A78E|nr:dynein axonemal intermediate chain 3 [Coccinella septempunctata]XP_044755939.1 dynein axonemal intermediate chain 3 [Coccinella septempunctata]